MQLVDPRKEAEAFNPNVDNAALKPKASWFGKIIMYLSCILILPIIWWVTKRNYFVRKQNRINEAASGIDIQLKKRRDTLVKLVDATESSIKFEKSLLKDVTRMRAGAFGGDGSGANVVADPKQSQRIGSQLAQSDLMRSRIMATFEAYPQIKTQANIAKLMDSAEDIEREIAATRRLYNSYVNEFNTEIFVWPSSILAERMKLVKLPLFVASATDRQDVSLKMES